jgi:hypothetical protein
MLKSTDGELYDRRDSSPYLNVNALKEMGQVKPLGYELRLKPSSRQSSNRSFRQFYGDAVSDGYSRPYQSYRHIK